jgi:hypothetical protein
MQLNKLFLRHLNELIQQELIKLKINSELISREKVKPRASSLSDGRAI